MIVCLCHRISDRQIRQAAAQGCADFEQLQEDLLVATACGACHDCATALFEKVVPDTTERKTWRLQTA